MGKNFILVVHVNKSEFKRPNVSYEFNTMEWIFGRPQHLIERDGE